MARSTAARILFSSAPPLRASHLRRRPLLLPTPRSKTTSSKPPRPPPRRDAAARKPAGGGCKEPAGPLPSLFQEISGVVASAACAASDPAFQLRMNEHVGLAGEALMQCTEGARRIAPVSEPAASGSFSDSIPNRDVPGGRSDDGGGPSGGATSAAPSWEASCQEVGDGNTQDSDLDNISEVFFFFFDMNISEVVHRIREVLQSEVPGSSMEQKLESLGITYMPKLVNMVLKRCFKKRHLGFRFFNWVKRVPGFQHTTETYNTMLYIVGEARSFGDMEELMDYMDKDMCLKDVKTWTILI